MEEVIRQESAIYCTYKLMEANTATSAILDFELAPVYNLLKPNHQLKWMLRDSRKGFHFFG